MKSGFPLCIDNYPHYSHTANIPIPNPRQLPPTKTPQPACLVTPPLAAPPEVPPEEPPLAAVDALPPPAASAGDAVDLVDVPVAVMALFVYPGAVNADVMGISAVMLLNWEFASTLSVA